jgi:hypothetical protein
MAVRRGILSGGIPDGPAYLAQNHATEILFASPVCVMDWARIGHIRQIRSLEAAAEQLIKWPNTKKRDKAAMLVANAYAGKADIEKAKKAFEVAAQEASVWVMYRGP